MTDDHRQSAFRCCLDLVAERPVTREDVAHLVRMSGRPPLEAGRRLLAVKLLCLRVDSAEVPEPIGMTGRRLELDAQITTAE